MVTRYARGFAAAINRVVAAIGWRRSATLHPYGQQRITHLWSPEQVRGATRPPACGTISLGVGIILALLTVGTMAAASTETVLYSFKGGRDGSESTSDRLIIDSTGALYGTTQFGGSSGVGTVFKLTPPRRGQRVWTETVLHSFKGGSDGSYPEGRLVFDKNGALYGTTFSGGGSNSGTVFKLTPPDIAKNQTAWTETVLYSFTGGSDGGYPGAGLLLDNNGAFYGTTDAGGSNGDGTVFKLTPPARGQTAWTETVLYSFMGGNDGIDPPGQVLVMNALGHLYGTTGYGGIETCQAAGAAASGCGTVFELTPPATGQTAWAETVLYSFKSSPDGQVPRAGVIMDASGALYGTTVEGGSSTCGGGCGIVFKLTPPARGQTAWTETVLYSFVAGNDGTNPVAPLLMDHSGALYGTTQHGGISICTIDGFPPGCGTVFKLTPPARGQTAWTETVLHSFMGGGDGGSPFAGLVSDNCGVLYGMTGYDGTAPGPGGTVYELTETGF